MTGRLLIGGPAGRNIAAMIAVVQTEMGRAVIEAQKLADPDKVRTLVLTGQVAGLVAGQTIELNGEVFRIVGAGAGPALSQKLIEIVQYPQVIAEPARAAPRFGGDRQYLKKTKGRS